MNRAMIAASLCFALSGCGGFRAIGPDGPVDVGDNIAVYPQIPWAAGRNQPATRSIWTVDGYGLNELRFYTGIKAQSPVFTVAGVNRRDLRAYGTTMLPDDVMEMIATTLARAGANQLRTEALRPTPFGRITGFRFDLTFSTSEGLEMKGAALFAQRRRRLDVILYIAPAEYYFSRYATLVEKIFESITVPDLPSETAGAS